MLSYRQNPNRLEEAEREQTSFCVVCKSVITPFELPAFTRAGGFFSCMHRYQADSCALEKRPSFAPVHATSAFWVCKRSDAGSTAQDKLQAQRTLKPVDLLRRMKTQPHCRKNISASIMLLFHFCFRTQNSFRDKHLVWYRHGQIHDRTHRHPVMLKLFFFFFNTLRLLPLCCF